MYNDRDRQRMAEIFNNAVASTCFGPLIGDLTKDDFSPDDNRPLIYFSTFPCAPDPLEKIFANCATDRRYDCRQFYHFKSVERAIDILKTGTVQLTALYYHSENDNEEYSEFFRRTGHTYPLTTGNVNELKKKSFVLCLTKSACREKFWTRYANDDKGVCLGLRYHVGGRDLQECVDFRDVSYGIGYPFDFIKEIRDRFVREFRKPPFIDGVLKFARFYKRADYSWEDESRISFDYKYEYSSLLCGSFPIQKVLENGRMREYIIVPLKSDYFTLEVSEIICGKQVCNADLSRLLAVSNLPTDRIRVRK